MDSGKGVGVEHACYELAGQELKLLQYYGGTCLRRPPLGPKLLATLDRWSYYAGSTECKRVI